MTRWANSAYAQYDRLCILLNAAWVALIRVPMALRVRPGRSFMARWSRNAVGWWGPGSFRPGDYPKNCGRAERAPDVRPACRALLRGDRVRRLLFLRRRDRCCAWCCPASRLRNRPPSANSSDGPRFPNGHHAPQVALTWSETQDESSESPVKPVYRRWRLFGGWKSGCCLIGRTCPFRGHRNPSPRFPRR